MFKNNLLLYCLLLFASVACAQQPKSVDNDTLVLPAKTPTLSPPLKTDSVKPYNPNIAIRRSAIVPGWGQITNKKYWKVPIVYGALGTTAFVFFRNLKQYHESRDAYANAIDGDTSNDYLIKQPYFSVKDQPQSIQSFRNAVRQNVDYSVLVFIVFWGLNVADAAVDAHLKTFDVSDNLSLQFKPGHSNMANTNGISLVLHIGR